PCSDIQFYFSKCLSLELLSNYSGCKTATQILQDQEVSEQAIMQFTCHKCVQG
ncbi:16764_t:CDS:1, partial [Funneliformis mosseae]